MNNVRRTLPELLTQMGEKDMREHLPSSVTGCNMLYLPNIGYVLAINEWNPTPPTKDATYPGLEFKFSINQVHYYKSSSAKGRCLVVSLLRTKLLHLFILIRLVYPRTRRDRG